MGAELLKFDGTFAKDNYLKDFRCSECKQFISKQDIKQKNYQLWVSDYANEVNKEECLNSTYYNLTFWLKSVEHEYCPEVETCEGCCERFLTSSMKEFNSEYYCLSCCQANKEVKHE